MKMHADDYLMNDYPDLSAHANAVGNVKHTCSHCGSTNLDGAMFTTAPGRCVCDDCFDE